MLRQLRILTTALSCLLTLVAHAQVDKVVYEAQRSTSDTLGRQGELYLKVDNLSFFRNNEYASHIVKGYSLPGLWIQPKVGYHLLDNVSMEVGAHLLCYWGANSYPCYAYTDIERWTGDKYQRGFHALPWFRAHIDLDCGFDLVMGNIFGGVNHQLIEPLYNKELAMTADPEMGIQMRYDHPHFESDVWLNWQSFIFKGDTHQEAFSLGAVMRANITPRQTPHHVYAYGQVIAQHRGGQLDTIHTSSAQTFVNEAAGLGWQWNANQHYFKRLGLELFAAGYHQTWGDLWPIDQGWGIGTRASAELGGFHLDAGYWYNRNFISIFGMPHFGSISTTSAQLFDTPHLLTVGAEYCHRFSDMVALGVDVDLYQRFENGSTNTSFTCGVYLRLTPYFTLWRNKNALAKR